MHNQIPKKYDKINRHGIFTEEEIQLYRAAIQKSLNNQSYEKEKKKIQQIQKTKIQKK